MNENGKIYDVITIGGGPAGLAAGIYMSRANLNNPFLLKARCIRARAAYSTQRYMEDLNGGIVRE